MSDDKPEKIKRPQQVYTLLIEVGRKAGDGLPKGATGAALMCFASGVDEAEAVRETVLILKQADLAPLDVTGYGTPEERAEMGHVVEDDERALMARALAENSVIVAQMTPFFDTLGRDAALGQEAEDGQVPDAAAPEKPKATKRKTTNHRSDARPGKGAGAKSGQKSGAKSGSGPKPSARSGAKPKRKP